VTDKTGSYHGNRLIVQRTTLPPQSNSLRWSFAPRAAVRLSLLAAFTLWLWI
jgi:hypothetical protein